MAGISKWEKAKRILCISVFTFSPLLILAFLCLFTGKNLFLSIPTWSDELDYFREMFSFSKNGFDFGGSLFVGYDAKIGPLGAHSVSPIVVWGIPSLFHWGAHSIFLFNLIFLCTAWLIFSVVVKTENKDTVLLLLLAFFYAPIIMYIFTSMIEIPLYAGIILFFACFYRYSETGSKLSLFMLLFMGIWCTCARITYIVILFPAIMLINDYKFTKKTVVSLVAYVALFLGGYKVYNLFCANYPDWVTASISNADGIVAKLKVIASNTKGNLIFYFSIHGERSQVALRYTFGMMILLLLFMSFFSLSSKWQVKRKFNAEAFSFFVMSGGLWAIMIVLYDIKDWRDFRTFAPILFLDFLFVFTKSSLGDTRRAECVIACSLLILLFVVSNKTLLTKDRAIASVVERVYDFDALDTEDENGNPMVLATTFDVNWGDQALMESIPSELGFQVFYKSIINDSNINCADYILTTEEYAMGHEEVIGKMVYITDVDGYGILYKVKKQAGD